MLEVIETFRYILPVLYGITLAVYAIDFFKEKVNLINSKRIFLFITIVSHLIYLILWIIEFKHAPITGKFEIFTVLACSIIFSYFVLELLTDVRGTGGFIILFAFLFQFVSSLFIEGNYEVKEVLRNPLLGVHVVSALFSYAGFTISAVYGVLFFALYKQMKHQKFGLIFNKLPSLETLEKMSFSALLIGYVLLTIAIIIGIIWLPLAFPNFSIWDPKLISTAIVWVVYGIGILLKLIGNWYGKKVIKFSLLGFVLVIASLIATSITVNTFHIFTD